MEALQNHPVKYILHDGSMIAWEEDEGFQTGVIRWNENVDGWVLIQPRRATPTTLGVIEWPLHTTIFMIYAEDRWQYTRKPKDWHLFLPPFKGVEAEWELATRDDRGIFRQ